MQSCSLCPQRSLGTAPAGTPQLPGRKDWREAETHELNRTRRICELLTLGRVTD